MDINALKAAILCEHVKISLHAGEEAANDELTLDSILLSGLQGEVIEDYPSDKPYPSCLILGFASSALPIHSVWAYNPSSQMAILITVYKPDPRRWLNFKTRIAQ